ncbi:MAG TPA: MFS transporter [Candidatus Saccharimonadales bacterium]|nr:MFS transporter [Candidatus Saccharimonadales bacterium]
MPDNTTAATTTFIPTATATETAKPANFKKWGTLVVLSLALAIIIIDTTILNVSLGTIIREFKTTIQNIQWVITAYSLTLAALTITGGRLGDFFGRKRMFMLGAIIFAIGSTITSFSHNVPTMIWGEAIIEGIGAALMMPATASLLVTTFKGRERAIAFGVWGGIAAASSAVGPVLGGWLTTHYSWRWAFRVNIFVALLLLVGSIIIAEARDSAEKPQLDWLGVFLSATGLLALVFGIIEASQYGWWLAKQTFVAFGSTVSFGHLSVTVPALLLGAILLTLFVWWEATAEKNGRTPLVSLELFKNRQFISGAVTTAVMMLGMSGLIFSLPVFLQSVRQLDAFHTGLALLPLSFAVMIVAPLAAALSHRFNPKYLIQAGLVLNGLGYLVMNRMINVDATVATFAPGLVLFGAGMGLVMSQINNLTLSAVSVQEAGEASGVNNTLRQLGSTLGSAIIGSVLLTALATNLVGGVAKSQKIPTALKPAISQQVATQTSNVEFSGGAQISGSSSPAIRQEIVAISHQATVDANKKTLAFGVLFSLLGLLVSISLPKIKNEHVEREESAATGH